MRDATCEHLMQAALCIRQAVGPICDAAEHLRLAESDPDLGPEDGRMTAADVRRLADLTLTTRRAIDAMIRG